MSTTKRPVLFRITAILSLCGALGGLPLQGKRTDDVVIMKNGDKFTGEIKKLQNGILYFKADYMADNVQLDWARVDSMDSKDSFNVSLLDGKHLIGVIVEQK